MGFVSLAGKPSRQMFSACLSLAIIFALSSVAVAEDLTHANDKSAISDDLLAEMGMDGMDMVSDEEGLKVRGKFIISGGDLNAILSRRLNPGEFLAINFAASETTQTVQQFTINLNLQKFQSEITRQLGLETQAIDFTNVNLQITETLAAIQTQSVQFSLIQSNGIPVLLGNGGGGGLRIQGGIFQ